MQISASQQQQKAYTNKSSVCKIKMNQIWIKTKQAKEKAKE